MDRPKFLPALEGLRGYAFLMVFAVHYTVLQSFSGSRLANGLAVVVYLGRLAVPLFFVLSGFLITTILYKAQGQQGFFRVYYWRRALRILPAYYATLALAAVIAAFTATQPHWQNLLLLVFLQNISTTALGLQNSFMKTGHTGVMVSHLWSLAVEEQFYLTWPVVVWALRDRRRLLWFCYTGIVAVNLLRLAWPVHFLNPALVYFLTVTRIDGVLMGCSLALHLQAGKAFTWILPLARVTAVTAIVLLVTWRPELSNESAPLTAKVAYPLMNILGTSLMLMALKDSWFQRLCSFSFVRYLGRLSYGLYLLHVLYLPWFNNVFLPKIGQYLPLAPAIFVTAVAAFALTLTLAMASYRFLEMPILRLRDRVSYGESATRRTGASEMDGERELHASGTLQPTTNP